jgi:nucleoside-diphosphate-sugar epimerase
LLRQCRAVIHLAARVHDAGASEAAYRVDNVEATLKLGRDAAAAGVRRLIFLSTAKVHGEASPPGRGFTEADPPAPQGAYACSKLAAEAGLRRIAGSSGLELVVIRPSLVHGPGAKANLRALMHAADRGWPLPLGAVRNSRSLVGVRNLVSLIALCIDHPAAAGETFLVSDGEDISTTELLRRLAALLGRPSRLLPVPVALLAAGLGIAGRSRTARSVLGDLRVDAGKARRLLGWQPELSLEAGLAEMVAGYRSPP